MDHLLNDPELTKRKDYEEIR